MSPIRALLLIGTRPEAIKMAPVYFQCREQASWIEPIVCLTSQHREMLAQVTDYFGLPADYNLNTMIPNQSLAELNANCLVQVDRVLKEAKPDCIFIQGDTTSAMAAGMAAFYGRVPVVHIEAGLRTGNLYSPWPEEFNRRVASIVATLHCAPTARARDRLLEEKVPTEAIRVTGNTVIDALLYTIGKERSRQDAWNAKFSFLGQNRMVLITGHRRENFGGGFQRICEAILALSRRFPDVHFVYPVHLNPNVRGPVMSLLQGAPNLHLLEPSPYPEFVWLMNRSALILTDSGGVQEEAPSLQKPLLIMRDTSERMEAIEAGAAELVGTETDRIVKRASELLTDAAEYQRFQIARNPFGDGRAAEYTLDFVRAHFRK